MQRNQRRGSQRNAVSQCGRAEAGKDLLDLAQDCGMTVTLDACIGRERYEIRAPARRVNEIVKGALDHG